jgi:hypothetical protein
LFPAKAAFGAFATMALPEVNRWSFPM